jgi:hypothetical protein
MGKGYVMPPKKPKFWSIYKGIFLWFWEKDFLVFWNNKIFYLFIYLFIYFQKPYFEDFATM